MFNFPTFASVQPQGLGYWARRGAPCSVQRLDFVGSSCRLSTDGRRTSRPPVVGHLSIRTGGDIATGRHKTPVHRNVYAMQAIAHLRTKHNCGTILDVFPHSELA